MYRWSVAKRVKFEKELNLFWKIGYIRACSIDVKNIDLQIKNIKNIFSLLWKNIIKNMHKNIELLMFSIATFFVIIHVKNI